METLLAREPAAPPDAAAIDELFDELYVEHYPRLVTFFGRRGLDPETSRDLAQKTMVRVYRGLAGFDGRSSHRTWLLAIATNLWRNWARDHWDTQKRGVPETSLEGVREDGYQVDDRRSLWPKRRPDPERRAIERQALERIRARLPSLARRQRECLELWLEGSLYQEIADRLGISLQTVRTSIHRGKARLERLLGPDFSETAS